MACPRWASEGVVKHSGCLNGGGQIKPEKREDMMLIAEKLKALEALNEEARRQGRGRKRGIR